MTKSNILEVEMLKAQQLLHIWDKQAGFDNTDLLWSKVLLT